MPLTLVISRKNALLRLVVRMPLLQTAIKIIGVLLLALKNGDGTGNMKVPSDGKSIPPLTEPLLSLAL